LTEKFPLCFRDKTRHSRTVRVNVKNAATCISLSKARILEFYTRLKRYSIAEKKNTGCIHVKMSVLANACLPSVREESGGICVLK